MVSIIDGIAHWLGDRLTRYLTQAAHSHVSTAPIDADKLLAHLKPGDVLLIEGQSRISAPIKYLTQSNWSHAALFIGGALGRVDAEGRQQVFVEAHIRHGVRAVSIAEFEGLHCRICRAVGLSTAEIDTVIGFILARLGEKYDLKNVIDLARYLFPMPPVPVRWRRRMIALGSGDPTRAICSGLIAEAFQAVHYPILPIIEAAHSKDPKRHGYVGEILHIRNHCLFVPRDFDVSPYFAIIKPALEEGFDHHRLVWQDSDTNN
ncbi:MAG: YiiX/YebB-like N1pC/P60 family cysteine hydrolase [Alphaproteobacteria bacterium]